MGQVEAPRQGLEEFTGSVSGRKDNGRAFELHRSEFDEELVFMPQILFVASQVNPGPSAHLGRQVLRDHGPDSPKM